MDKILTITIPGLLIEIPGIPPFRTPAIIDITKLNENIVIGELTKQGIKDFIIKEKESVIQEKYIRKMRRFKKETNEEKNEFNEIIENFKRQQESIDKLELLIKQLVQLPHGKQQIEEIQKKINVEEMEDFIPSIDLTKIKLNIKKRGLQNE